MVLGGDLQPAEQPVTTVREEQGPEHYAMAIGFVVALRVKAG